MAQDADRLPPDQYLTEDWPILHYGDIPRIDLHTYRFKVWGLVEQPLDLGWEDLQALPQAKTQCDIHCVTHWSRYDNSFEGVALQELFRRCRPKPEAKFVMFWAQGGWNTNVPMSDADRPENLLAFKWAGEPITRGHGWPARVVIPHLYFWKSAKWCIGMEFMTGDKPGFWERNGYHMRGDPWKSERYGSD